jgi:hypothetical protein
MSGYRGEASLRPSEVQVYPQASLAADGRLYDRVGEFGSTLIQEPDFATAI